MRYMFLNHFVFESINSSCQDEEILGIFNQLASLLKDLRSLNCELIFDNRLSLVEFNGQNIQYYLKLLEKEAMLPLIAKIQKSLPFCSNTYDEYSGEESIVFGNCILENSDIEILETFLACALFLNAPVVTSKTLCSNGIFLDDIISIKCDDDVRILDNYFLEDKDEIITNLEKSIKETSASWLDWRSNNLPLFKNIAISDDFFEDIKIHSFNSKYASSIIRFIETINIFVEGKKVNNIKYDECCSYTTPEPESRLRKYKNQLTVQNCDGLKEVANWHTRINKDFRLYFTFDEVNNKVCLVKFTKKIS